MAGTQSVQFRRAEMPCSPGTVLPYDLRGGSSIGGESGFLVLVSCRPNRKAPDIVVVAGWTPHPDAQRTPIHAISAIGAFTPSDRSHGKAASAVPPSTGPRMNPLMPTTMLLGGLRLQASSVD